MLKSLKDSIRRELKVCVRVCIYMCSNVHMCVVMCMCVVTCVVLMQFIMSNVCRRWTAPRRSSNSVEKRVCSTVYWNVCIFIHYLYVYIIRHFFFVSRHWSNSVEKRV